MSDRCFLNVACQECLHESWGESCCPPAFRVIATTLSLCTELCSSHDYFSPGNVRHAENGIGRASGNEAAISVSRARPGVMTELLTLSEDYTGYGAGGSKLSYGYCCKPIKWRDQLIGRGERI